MSWEAVKVQRPLSTSAEGEPCLIYDARHTHQAFVEFHTLPEPIRLELEKRPRVYALGRWRGRKGWELGAITGDRPW